MQFTNAGRKLSAEEIEKIESETGLRFPTSLRQFYLKQNGGEPDPYVLEHDELFISTVISKVLPLLSSHDNDTATDTYHNLVIGKALVPRSFFPFAVDGGGDYFFINCNTGGIHYIKSDRYPEMELIDLQTNLDGFWQLLQPE
ncbi:SMI1 / KNR4 family protein [Gimesia panareensis]|uniref:SMI1 / KNR4 family protein n=1 Tax=Gimesia panareensis TaxID=2527978 RepID=A0A518FYL9_9PLAN|nr:SMI1/KNR4 family protein [Gimesia panareensis]QDV21468.1 SMI1 / KNR4 family protein [Gimesia panareensis]